MIRILPTLVLLVSAIPLSGAPGEGRKVSLIWMDAAAKRPEITSIRDVRPLPDEPE